MPDLEIRDIAKSFGDQRALAGVSFTVGDGEFFTLLGPSGCGKSTTLMSIAGLERPDAGSIRLGGEVFFDAASGRFATPEERNLGMVFQSYALWPHMTVEANLAMPLRLRKVGKRARRELIDHTLDQVGMVAYKDRYPHQLSGGQQQRVALARALVYSPKVLLLDEPLSNLDAKLRDRARAWLKDLQQNVGVTAVYVTHDQLEALSLSDRVAVMRDGAMLQIAAPREIYEHPTDPAVADFIGHCSFLPGTVSPSGAGSGPGSGPDTGTGTGSGTVQVELRSGDRISVADARTWLPGTEVSVGVRSERFTILPADAGGAQRANSLAGEVVKVTYAGARYEYELMVGGQVVSAEHQGEITDVRVRVHIPADGAYLFEAPRAVTVGRRP